MCVLQDESSPFLDFGSSLIFSLGRQQRPSTQCTGRAQTRVLQPLDRVPSAWTRRNWQQLVASPCSDVLPYRLLCRWIHSNIEDGLDGSCRPWGRLKPEGVDGHVREVASPNVGASPAIMCSSSWSLRNMGCSREAKLFTCYNGLPDMARRLGARPPKRSGHVSLGVGI